MSSFPYFELHAHSHFSALDGLGTPEQVAARLQELGQTGTATTEHGTILSHIPFEQTFRAANLLPVFGIELYMVRDRAEHVAGRNAASAKKGNVKLNHLTVLAETQHGYRNLLRLFDISSKEGYRGKPAVDWDDVVRHQEGLVVLSGCVGGMLASILYPPEDKEKAKKWEAERAMEMARKWLIWLMGSIERFYAEIVPCPGLGISHESCPRIWTLAQELGIPAVLTSDAHFPCPEDHAAEDLMVAIQTHKKLRDPERRLKIPACHFHTTGEEVVRRAQTVVPSASREELIEAASRTVEIANRCQIELPRSKGPVFAVPTGMTVSEQLCDWVEEGWEYRKGLGLLPEPESDLWYKYRSRITYELDIIFHHSFQSYFLIVADLVRWAHRERRWCVARGSCGGSLVCWLLGITQIDPIRFKLPVERFIDKTRTDYPDIDCDFDARYQDAAREYLERKYGKERCAQIAALSTFRPKQAVIDAVKALNDPAYGRDRLTPEVGERLIKLLPELDQEGGIKAKGLLKQLFETNDEAKALLRDYPSLRLASEIEGQVRQQTIHAAGFVVDGEDLSNLVGIMTLRDGSRVITCDMGYAARQGFLKIDVLSVEMMSAVSETLEAIGKDHDWLYQIPLDDPITYDLLSRGLNTGIFQMKGGAAGQLLTQVKPSQFTDLIALAALARPGPLQSGGAAEYVDRKHGRERVPDYHPRVKEVVGDTFGVVIYQEQVMGLMRVAGFDWPDVHKIRKLVSKSGGTAALDNYHPAYLEGMCQAGVPEREAEHFWLQCQKAGNYVFPKAHGATYAQHAYWTAYLKAHHPGAFYCASLNHEKKEEYRLKLVAEFRRLGGQVELLHFNESGLGFTSPRENVILGGLSNLRGIGPELSRRIIAHRPYRDWLHFLRTIPDAAATAIAATKVHKGEVDPEVALALASWFGCFEYLSIEQEAFRMKACHRVADVIDALEQGCAPRPARLLGRVTDCVREPGKKGGERCELTITDPTGSIPVLFAAWRWSEVEQYRDPLRGNPDGIGNSLYIVATPASDGGRIFGDDAVWLRSGRGFQVLESKKKRKATGPNERQLGLDLDFGCWTDEEKEVGT